MGAGRSVSNFPPGAIRRTGSTPARGGGSLPRGSSLAVVQKGDCGPATGETKASSDAARHPRDSAVRTEPCRSASPRPEIGDLHIDDTIPSEADDSSDEEVLAPVRTAGARGTA